MLVIVVMGNAWPHSLVSMDVNLSTKVQRVRDI